MKRLIALLVLVAAMATSIGCGDNATSGTTKKMGPTGTSETKKDSTPTKP